MPTSYDSFILNLYVWSYITQLQKYLQNLIFFVYQFFKYYLLWSSATIAMLLIINIYMVSLWNPWKEKKKGHSFISCAGNTEAVP